jgi:hypothetical protein
MPVRDFKSTLCKDIGCIPISKCVSFHFKVPDSLPGPASPGLRVAVSVLHLPRHLREVSRGVDPPRQFTFCCSTRKFAPLPHSISRDPNDPASGNGRNRANELFVPFPLWERPPTRVLCSQHCSSSEVDRYKIEHFLWKCIHSPCFNGVCNLSVVSVKHKIAQEHFGVPDIVSRMSHICLNTLKLANSDCRRWRSAQREALTREI